MVLRAAIVLLLMLNLGAAAWWWFGGEADGRKPAEPDVVPAGTPTLRLVSEATPAQGSVQSAPTQPLASQPAAPLEPPAAGIPMAPAMCLRLGPFVDAGSRDAARASLAGLAGQVVARETPGRASRGWWVFLPALPSRDEARALGERIRAAGITDWYVMNEGDQANSIALGRYGSEEAARRREAELRAKGFPAQAAPLGARTAQWWLDVRLAAGASPAALVAIAPSTPIECASLR